MVVLEGVVALDEVFARDEVWRTAALWLARAVEDDEADAIVGGGRSG